MTVCVIGGALVAFMWFRVHQETLQKDFKQFLETRFSQFLGLKIRFGGLRGNFLGSVSVLDLSVSAADSPEEEPFLFISRATLRYRLWDLILKRYGAFVSIELERPHLKVRPHFKTQSASPSNGADVVRWCNRLGPYFTIQVRDGFLSWGLVPQKIGPIQGEIENGEFKWKVLLNHWMMAGYDVITTLQLKGNFLSEHGKMAIGHRITGTAETKDTIIQFNPIPEESDFSFEITEDRLQILSSHFFGEITLSGWWNLAGSSEMDLELSMNQFSFDRLSALMGRVDKNEGSVSGTIFLKSSGTSTRLKGALSIQEGVLGHVPFRLMNINFEGDYPLVRLSDSGMVLNDGSSIKFADELIPMSALFDAEIYRKLARQAAQETFVWKGWQFSREKDSGGVEMQPTLGEDVKLFYKKITVDEADKGEQPSTGVGVEYHLNSGNALRVEKSDVNDFVGVEHKLKF